LILWINIEFVFAPPTEHIPKSTRAVTYKKITYKNHFPNVSQNIILGFEMTQVLDVDKR